VSIPAILFFVFFVDRPGMNQSFYEHSKLWQVSAFLLTGSHITAFWFIPMISIFFLLSPLMLKIDTNPRLYLLLIGLIVVSIVVPRGNSPIVNFLHFLSVYVTGMWLSHSRSVSIPYLAKRIWVLLFLYAATYAIFTTNMTSPAYFANLSYFNKLILSLLLLSLLFKYDGLIGKKGDFLASISFGIFFIHSYNLQAFRFLSSESLMATTSWEGSFFHQMLLFLIVIVACSLQILVIKKILGKYSRYVIGC
jgi:hypothetical protein